MVFLACYPLPASGSSFSLLWTTFLLAVNLLHDILGVTTWLAFALSLMLLAVYFLTGLTYIVLQFRENHAHLREALRVRAKGTRSRACILGPLLRTNLLHFGLIFLFDSFFGVHLTAYLFLHLPISAYFMIRLLSGSVNLMSLVAMIAFSLEALIGSIGCHLYMAFTSGYIHRSGKMLLAYSAATSGFKNRARKGKVAVREKFFLSAHIQRLVVRRKYGITIAGFGLCSMKTLTRTFLLYGELLMYVHSASFRASQ